MQTDWLGRLLFDYDGVARFFRKASGGRHYVEWRAFWPGDLMTLSDKQALDNLLGDPVSPPLTSSVPRPNRKAFPSIVSTAGCGSSASGDVVMCLHPRPLPVRRLRRATGAL